MIYNQSMTIFCSLLMSFGLFRSSLCQEESKCYELSCANNQFAVNALQSQFPEMSYVSSCGSGDPETTSRTYCKTENDGGCISVTTSMNLNPPFNLQLVVLEIRRCVTSELLECIKQSYNTGTVTQKCVQLSYDDSPGGGSKTPEMTKLEGCIKKKNITLPGLDLLGQVTNSGTGGRSDGIVPVESGDDEYGTVVEELNGRQAGGIGSLVKDAQTNIFACRGSECNKHDNMKVECSKPGGQIATSDTPVSEQKPGAKGEAGGKNNGAFQNLSTKTVMVMFLLFLISYITLY